MPTKQLGWDQKDPGMIVQAIIELQQGRSNAVGTVTLAVSPATSTVVPFKDCSVSSNVILSPRTAHASALYALGTVFILKANIINNQFTITHPASVNADNTFDYTCSG
jgi:hypothetical protein